MKRVIKNIYKKYLGNKISKSILSLALPIIIQNILFTLMGFADQVMVGQLGETVISAIGNAAQLSLFLFLLFSAIGQGGAILISQYYGAKETDKLKKTLSSIIFIGFFIGIAFFLITYFFGNTMIFYILTLGRWENVANVAGEYLKITSFSSVFLVPGSMITGALRSMGDTKTPVKISVATNALNIVGNFFLIFGIGPFPQLGFKGAAISTLISGTLQGILLLIVILNKKKLIEFKFTDFFKPNFEQIKKILQIGYPMSIDGFYWQGARMFYTIIFNFIGSGAFAAYSIVRNFKGMAFLPVTGISSGVMINVGHNLGKKNMKRAVIFAHRGILLGLLIVLLPVIILIAFSKLLIGIYKITPDTFFTAWVCLLILSVSLFFTTINSIIPGILRAGGDTKSVLYITLFSFLIIGAPLSYLLGIVLKLGAIGAFIGVSTEEVIKSLIFLRQLKKKKWLRCLK